MAIRFPKHRKSIGRKFLVGNLIILAFTMVLVMVLSFFVVQVYLRQSTKEELRNAGKDIVLAMDKLKGVASDTSSDPEKRLQALRSLQAIRIAGRLVDAKLVLVDAKGDIRYTNVEHLDRQQFESLKGKLNFWRSPYVYVAVPFKSSKNEAEGRLYLITKLEDVSGLNKGLAGILIGCLVMGTLVASILSIWMQKRIGKPMEYVVSRMSHFSLRDFEPINVHTEDEVQTLAESFNNLVDKLKKADEAQKQFFQNASHELKTPLMSVQGYAEAIRDGVLEGDEVEKSLDIIIEESQRLKKLVDDFLTLTRLEYQEELYHFSFQNVSESVREALQAVGGMSQDYSAKISLEIQNDFKTLLDSNRFKQCIINLLGNSIRYAETQVVARILIEKGMGIVEIEDDGPGLPKEDPQCVFQRFYKGKDGGTGIGLTIAKTIVEKHGGTIVAGNSLSGGAVFKIEIPIKSIDVLVSNR